MDKKEFLYWCQWLKVRWPNAKLDDFTVKSLFEDFKIYDDDVFGKVLLDYFDSGNDFLDWSKLKKLCREAQVEQFALVVQQKKLAAKVEDERIDPPSSLETYLEMNGYKSFAEAVFYKTQHLYKYNQSKQWQKDLFKPFVNMTYESATDKGWRFGIGGIDE